MDNNETNRSGVRESIDDLIQQDVKMKQALTNAEANLKNWYSREITLDNSNEKLKMELKNIQKENENFAKTISTLSESTVKLDEEFKEYKEKHDKENKEFVQYFEEEIEKYRKFFINAEFEYDIESLKKNIEHYHELSNDTTNQIVEIDKKIVELTDENGLIELNASDEAKCLEDHQQFEKILLEDNKSLLLSKRLAENKLLELNSKIRQIRRKVENLSKKTKQ